MIAWMDVAVVRSNIPSIVGLAGVALALAAVVRLVPHDTHDPARAWEPPVGYVVADTVSVSGDRTLRLWTGPAGWYVESLAAGRHEGSVGASGGGDQFTVSEILGGFVGNVPVAGTGAVSVRTRGGVAVHANVHDGMFVLPAHMAGATEPAVLVTPLDATGRPLAAETSVPIAGGT
jgi:hypothetical protein